MINFVRMWVTNYFYDFEDDQAALDQIKSFMSFVSQSGLEKQAEPINAAINRKVCCVFAFTCCVSSNCLINFYFFILLSAKGSVVSRGGDHLTHKTRAAAKERRPAGRSCFVCTAVLHYNVSKLSITISCLSRCSFHVF